MGFQNKGYAQPIANQKQLVSVSVNPQTIPLDVVTYGGLQLISNVFSDGAAHQILPTPSGGTAYSLRRLTINNTTGVVALVDAADAQYGCCTPVSVFDAAPDNLEGLLAAEALFVQNSVVATYRVTLFYDVVSLPQIS